MAEPRVKRPTKAAQFADTAEAAGWAVTREKGKVDGKSTRRVTAVRGQEAFEFVWVRNPDTDRDMFVSGRHRQAVHIEDWSNIKAALRIVGAPEASIRVVTDAEGEHRIVRLPFDIEEATDEEIKAHLSHSKVVWTNTLTNRFEEAICPPTTSRHFKVKPHPHFENNGERIVEFFDQDVSGVPVAYKFRASGPFRAFHLSQLISVN